MDVNTFLVTVFCIVDDYLKGKQLRSRGPTPTLRDSEVLTMEIVGEFLGFDKEKHLFLYFRTHFAGWFPALRNIHRTTFTRQMANLCFVKEKLWQHVLGQIDFDRKISLMDSFPMPVCRFARAYRCRRLREVSAFGHDEVAKQTFFGLRVHLQVCWPGVIVNHRLVAANIHEVEVAEEMLSEAQGWTLGDRNYWNPRVAEEAKARGLYWLAPYKSAKREPQPWPRWMKHKRYRIETVIGQLVERFHAKRVWARDSWHLLSRWLRKILSHTIAVLLCQQADLPPLQFANLITR